MPSGFVRLHMKLNYSKLNAQRKSQSQCQQTSKHVSNLLGVNGWSSILMAVSVSVSVSVCKRGRWYVTWHLYKQKGGRRIQQTIWNAARTLMSPIFLSVLLLCDWMISFVKLITLYTVQICKLVCVSMKGCPVCEMV